MTSDVCCAWLPEPTSRFTSGVGMASCEKKLYRRCFHEVWPRSDYMKQVHGTSPTSKHLASPIEQRHFRFRINSDPEDGIAAALVDSTPVVACVPRLAATSRATARERPRRS